MKFNILKKLIISTVLTITLSPILAKEITLMYESEDAEPKSLKFGLPAGGSLTHQLLTHLIKKHFGFTSSDLDRTTLAILYPDNTHSDIFIDLEIEGRILEFQELMNQEDPLTVTVIKNKLEDMLDDDDESYDSDLDLSGETEDAIGSPNLIKVIYDTPIQTCKYVYDADLFGNITYDRLRRILLDECGIDRETIKHCYAGLLQGKDIIPIADLAYSDSMKEIPGINPGSIIHVFNWKS